jgi:hypothetical protein
MSNNCPPVKPGRQFVEKVMAMYVWLGESGELPHWCCKRGGIDPARKIERRNGGGPGYIWEYCDPAEAVK